jgi:hypothetical protein
MAKAGGGRTSKRFDKRTPETGGWMNAWTSEHRKRANAGNRRAPGTGERWERASAGTSEHRKRVSAGNERVERTLDQRTPRTIDTERREGERQIDS